MIRKAFFQAVVLFVLLGLPVAVFFLRQSAKAPSAAEGVNADAAERMAGGGQVTASADPAQTPAFVPRGIVEDGSGETTPFEMWEGGFAELGRRGAAGQLELWRETLRELPPEEATRRLLAFLETGRDVPTGLEFAPGSDGALTTAPTLRTAVLDLLGQLDPAAAFVLAAEALEAKTESPDEYALHLRNFAWGRPESFPLGDAQAYLAEKTLELLKTERWQAAPSGGFQEAFDVLVWAEAGEALPLLDEFLRPGQPVALSAPAAIAFERLHRLDPERALDAILRAEPILADRPGLAAQAVAAVDFTRPAAREQVGQYFLDDRRTAAERDRFLAMVPNLNQTWSHNLLSTNPPVGDPESLRAQLEGAETILTQWREAPAFAPWSREIEGALVRVRDHLAPLRAR